MLNKAFLVLAAFAAMTLTGCAGEGTRMDQPIFETAPSLPANIYPYKVQEEESQVHITDAGAVPIGYSIYSENPSPGEYNIFTITDASRDGVAHFTHVSYGFDWIFQSWPSSRGGQQRSFRALAGGHDLRVMFPAYRGGTKTYAVYCDKVALGTISASEGQCRSELKALLDQNTQAGIKDTYSFSVIMEGAVKHYLALNSN